MSILLGLMVVASTGSITLTADDRRTTTVSSADLDLSREADVRLMHNRVDIAISRVCEVSGRTVKEMTWRNDCRVETMQRAQGQVEQVLAAARLSRPTQLTAR